MSELKLAMKILAFTVAVAATWFLAINEPGFTAGEEPHPPGANARCQDGSMSFRQGDDPCAGHGGVQTLFN